MGAHISVSWPLTPTALNDIHLLYTLPLFHTYQVQTRSLLSYECKHTHTRTQTRSLCAFSYLCAIHEQRVNDPVSSLPAAHSLHTAVVVSECEMRFRAIIHKLPLQEQIRQKCGQGEQSFSSGASLDADNCRTSKLSTHRGRVHSAAVSDFR